MASCAPPTRPRSPAISGPRPRRWPGATGCAGSRAAHCGTPYWRYGSPHREGDRDGGPAAHQLRPARSDGRADAGGDGAMQPGGNPAAGELGGPGARARLLLVLRPVMGRDLPARRLRPPDQGAVPRLHLPLGELRVLRQPAFGAGGGPGSRRGQVRRAAELREVGPLHRAGEGGARLRGGDRLEAAHRRRLLGAHARSLHRAGTGGARLRHRAHVRAAKLAPAAEHRAPRGDAGHGRLARPRLRDPRGHGGGDGRRRLLGQALSPPPGRPTPGPDAGYPVFSPAEMARRREALTAVLHEHGAGHALVYGFDRSGSAIGWLTGWPVTREAALVFTPGERYLLFVCFNNHVPNARRLAPDADVRPGNASALGAALDVLASRAGQGATAPASGL